MVWQPVSEHLSPVWLQVEDSEFYGCRLMQAAIWTGSERAPLQQWSAMVHSLTPLPSHALDSRSVAASCSHASGSKLPPALCRTGELCFRALECGALFSCKPVALNPCRPRSSRLQAWPNVSCSVAFTSDSTTFSKPELARNSSVSRSFLLQEATEVSSSNSPEEIALEGDPGKVFVGNLPYHVKREAVKEYFSQCGPVRDIIFIRSHSDPEKNKGYCFLFFGGPDPSAAAIRAADLDGADFFGKLLRVKIDDGRWERDRREQRERWVESGAVRCILCCSNFYSL